MLAKVNIATEGGTLEIGRVTFTNAHTDLRWAMQHAAAASACSAYYNVNNTPLVDVVIAKPGGGSCTNACRDNTPTTSGIAFTCAIGVGVGAIRLDEASGYTDLMSTYTRFTCNDTSIFSDELNGGGLTDPSAYTAYCCCYH
ncbi:MAG TPA: hypothetical protein VHE35_28130 [Kofleriaceae bacterium]|nr:hypothetical protein [Kofleriaceae bacterium]